MSKMPSAPKQNSEDELLAGDNGQAKRAIVAQGYKIARLLA